ncbi:hypothetical protein DFH06DRAFT_1466376 [Mycena polygramma]|nr:hypothetical protein DFH06DRAFT_1466376 [Mycena polygramma]
MLARSLPAGRPMTARLFSSKRHHVLCGLIVRPQRQQNPQIPTPRSASVSDLRPPTVGMTSTPSVPDLGPHHLVVDGVYIFNEFSALLAYIWTGVDLKTDHDTYLGNQSYLYDQASISCLLAATTNLYLQFELAYALDPLLSAYGDIKTHCTVFRDGPLQTIGDLNDNISAYADKVGWFGTGLYAGILANIRLLAAERAKDPNSALAKSLQTTITTDVNDLVNSITPIKNSTDGIITLLNAFETQCGTDAMALQKFHEAAVRVPTGPRGNWTMEETMAEYRARLTVFGHIQIDVDGMVDKIQAAVNAIQVLIGEQGLIRALDALSHDLGAFQHYVDHDVRTLANAFPALVENNLSHRWSEIKSFANAFKASIGRPL